ncbi:MAG: RecX family transcriptional regulator [Candidatus Wallbacteria bacterium]|nr:RecX family transcriptional regulator [Candidatus Wallbacteria bacterium]
MNDKAFEYCLDLLKKRDRTSYELAVKLAGKGFGENDSVPVLKRLSELGLIDDNRVIKDILKDRLYRRPMGRDGLTAVLEKSGIPGPVAEQSAEMISDQRIVDAVLDYIDRNPRFLELKRLNSFLRSGGFEAEMVETILIRLGISLE